MQPSTPGSRDVGAAGGARGSSLLENVVLFANDAVVITDAARDDTGGPKIVYVNDAFERMTGYARADVVGRAPRFLQGPLTSAETRERLRGAIANGESVRAEVLNYARDGRTFWADISLVPVTPDGGETTHWISIQRDVSDRYRALPGTDDLTGLIDRAGFISHLMRASARVRAADAGYAVLYFDLDRFKMVNDSLGHRAGDSVLRLVAERLRDRIGNDGVLARMGGDEFALLVEPLELRVTAFAQKILDALREPISAGAITFTITASVGIVTGRLGDEPENVVRDADIAMYRAKKGGGDRYVLYDEAMHREALAAFALHRDLRGAIANDEFAVYFQPLVRLASGEPFGFEALVRWQHPQRGLVSPLEFIDVAEETGAIVAIGRSVLRKSCAAWGTWCDAFPNAAPLRLSVNVSSVQLRDANFVEMLRATLGEFGIPEKTLQIEITESVLVGDAIRAGAMLEAIRAMGVLVAIDDFGTGYSSLAYLERYPIDVLKIDRSFVSRVTAGQRSVNLLRTIAELARTLEIDILAEGVETQVERAVLLGIGFKTAQGYAFAKPMSGESVVGWLRSMDFGRR